MTTRVLTVLVLVALLVTGALCLALDGGDDARPAVPPPPVGSLDVDEQAPVDGLVAAAEADLDLDGEIEGDLPDPRREEVVTFAPDEVGGPALRVIEAASRRPVPFAEVFVGDPSAEWRARRQGDGVQHWADLLERNTQPRRADGQGVVQLPPVRRRVLVAARSEGMFGVGIVREDDSQPVLEMVVDRTLLVRVVDAFGQPQAGVHVGLCVDMRDRLQRRSRALTDAAGIAELRHVQLFETRVPPPDPEVEQERRQMRERMERFRGQVERAQLQLAGGTLRLGNVNLQVVTNGSTPQDLERMLVERLVARQQQERERVRQVERQVQRAAEARQRRDDPEARTWPIADFVVLAEVPQVQPAQLRLPATTIPTDPVELRLMAQSRLVVRLVGPDGSPLRSPCRVILRRSRVDETPDPDTSTIDELCMLRVDKPAGDSPATFAPVGLGLRFDVLVHFADNDFNFAQADVAGPNTPQPLEVTVQTPGWFTAISGRLVDAAGNAVPELDAELFVAGSRGRVEGEQLRLEPDGRFELPVRLRQATPPYTLEIQASVGDRRFGKLQGLPELAPGRRIDVGEVVLVELPALASGVVCDDLGRPLRNAMVMAQVLRENEWRDESFVRANTDAEGAFVLYGEERPQRLRLRAAARGHASVERDIRFGDAVEITLPRLGGIHADGLLPDYVSREVVRVTIAEVGGSGARELPVRMRPDQRFEVRADGLRPGTWDVSLRVRGLPRPLAIADRVVVAPGQVARPGALDGLDLRGRLFQYVVRAVDRAGQAVNSGSPLLVQLHDAAGVPSMVPFSWRGGRIELITDEPSLTVVGLTSGHKPVRALLQPGESTLTFDRVHPLRLQLTGLRALLGAEQRARISLVFVGDTGLPDTDVRGIDQRSGRQRGYARASLGKSSGAFLGAGDEVTVPLMLNGRYDIVLRLDGPGGRVSKSIGRVDAVLDGAEPQLATVSPDATAVRDAMAELAALPPRGR